MNSEQIRSGLNDVFRDVFDDPAIMVRDEMTAKDVPAWDSVSHIDMICAVEQKFGIKVTTREVANLKNVGELAALIGRKVPS
jgi:acyl carrier protein